ncbi:VCBS domain-containing protein, partial [Thiotrichales bacterium 19S3-7]|nr:VCBS domain-containing protein [Thiotrichales bacterium 19S3-7]
TVTDEHNATDTENLVITITGTNDGPTISTSIESATEDGVIITGSIVASDADSNAQLTYSTAANIAGFTLNNDGSYSFDPNHFDYDSLNHGEMQTITIPITVTDEHNATDTENLVITITGTNDGPTISTSTESATEGGVIITGSIVASDADSNAQLTYSTAANIAGFTLNNDGSYSFDPNHFDYDSLNHGEMQTITIPITVTDEHNATDTENLVITITGTNDGPTISTSTESATEGGVIITGSIVASDADSNAQLTYSTAANIAGFTLNNDGSYSFDPNHFDYDSLNHGEMQTITIPTTVTDEHNATDTENLVITITGTNDGPTISTSIESATEGGVIITGSIVASDADSNAQLTYSTAANIAGFTLNNDGSYSFDPNHATYNGLNSGDVHVLSIPVTVTDELGAAVTANLTINLAGTNDMPIIMAQSINVNEGDPIISANLSATDADTNAQLTYSTVANIAGFMLNSDGSYSFDPSHNHYNSLNDGVDSIFDIPVTVTDEYAASDSVNLTVTISGINDVPIISGDVAGNVTEDINVDAFDQITTSGQLSILDYDYNESFFVSETLSGQFGVFEISDSGQWSYAVDNNLGSIQTLDDNEYLVENFNVVSVDGTLTNVTITINGNSNDNSTGTNSDDNIFLTDNSDLSFAYGGNDLIYAYGGNDIIFAGSGNDVVYGGAGNDHIFAGSGNDVIDAGSGNDNSWGGNGNDIFSLNYSSLNSTIGNDYIDGGSGWTDIIEINSIDALPNQINQSDNWSVILDNSNTNININVSEQMITFDHPIEVRGSIMFHDTSEVVTFNNIEQILWHTN